MRPQHQPLEVGTRVRLREVSPTAIAHMTRVEEVTDRWIGVQRPTHNYEPVRFYRGAKVELNVVRTHPPEGIFRAETFVLGEVHQRVPMLRLEVPAKWERAQLREFFRVDAVRPVRVRRFTKEGDLPWVEGHTRDVSGGGCQLALPEMLDQGELIEIELELPEGIYRMRGTVQRAQEDRSAQGFSAIAGIKFQDLTEKQREELIRYAFERQIELRRKGMS